MRTVLCSVVALGALLLVGSQAQAAELTQLVERKTPTWNKRHHKRALPAFMLPTSGSHHLVTSRATGPGVIGWRINGKIMLIKRPVKDTGRGLRLEDNRQQDRRGNKDQKDKTEREPRRPWTPGSVVPKEQINEELDIDKADLDQLFGD